MERLIKDHKVAVILSKGLGYWYNEGPLEWNYLPELIHLVESEEYLSLKKRSDKTLLVRNTLIKAGWTPNKEDIFDQYPLDTSLLNEYYVEENEKVFCVDTLQGHYLGGADHLVVEWVDTLRSFIVEQGDCGGDFVRYRNKFNWQYFNLGGELILE